MTPLAAAVLAALLTSPASAADLAAGPAYAADLPNFGAISQAYYRGGQPTEMGIKLLKQLGVDVVFNLRGDPLPYERKAVEDAGMRYVFMPMSEWRKPTPAEIVKFFAVTGDPASGRVFVHCRRGADRTGYVSAIRRIETDGWGPRQAVDEMIAFKALVPSLILYVFRYYKENHPGYEIPDLHQLYPRIFEGVDIDSL